MKTGSGLSDDMMVVTSEDVAYGGQPVLLVSHEEDEEGPIWQFHTGDGDYSIEKMMLVSAATMLNIDPSLEEVFGLALGLIVRRETMGGAWSPDEA